MALSKVTRTIRDGANVALAWVFAKVGTPPSAAADADTLVSAHALVDTAEALINPATSDKQASLGAVSSATLGTPLASAATSAQLLAANAARKGLFIVNTDANDCYIKFGTTASLTSFTAIVPGNKGQWEMPQPIYTGRIDAIWAADGSGSAYPTEL